jgi:hypothetical protein
MEDEKSFLYVYCVEVEVDGIVTYKRGLLLLSVNESFKEHIQATHFGATAWAYSMVPEGGITPAELKEFGKRFEQNRKLFRLKRKTESEKNNG